MNTSECETLKYRQTKINKRTMMFHYILDYKHIVFDSYSGGQLFFFFLHISFLNHFETFYGLLVCIIHYVSFHLTAVTIDFSGLGDIESDTCEHIKNTE